MPKCAATASRRLAGSARAKVRRRYRLRVPAYVYMLVTVFIAVGAFNSQNNLLFWAFGLSLAAMVVSGVLSGTMLMGVEIERRALGDARAGDRMAIAYTVRNRNSFVPAFAMRIEELATPRWGAWGAWGTWGGWVERARKGSARGGKGKGRGHRAQAASKGAKHGAVGTGGTSGGAARGGWTEHVDKPLAFIAHVGPGETLTARVDVLARRRGRVRFHGVRLISSFPFGLIRKTVEYQLPEEAVVTPAPLPTPRDARDLLGRIGDAAIASRRQGPGDEFFALREYVPGDPMRSIAWRASARRMELGGPGSAGPSGGLLVKQNASPAPARLWIVLRLDHAPGAAAGGGSRDNEAAISLAVGLAAESLEKGLAVGLAVPRAGVVLRPQSGAGQFHTIARELGVLELGRLDRSRDAGRFPAAAAGPGSIVVAIHAGVADRSFGPGLDRALHIATSSLEHDQPAPANGQRGRR